MDLSGQPWAAKLPDGLRSVARYEGKTYNGDGGRASVQVLGLRVDGRQDQPLGLDDPGPLLSWRTVHTARTAGHRCYRPGSRAACPGDRQTAYQIQVADSARRLDRGRLLWDSGKVESAVQSGVRYGGRPLASRQRVVWRVRVWDAEHRRSAWSRPSSWEVGLLQPADWGAARWIEYPGRTEDQPMPIFARRFTVDRRARGQPRARARTPARTRCRCPAGPRRRTSTWMTRRRSSTSGPAGSSTTDTSLGRASGRTLR